MKQIIKLRPMTEIPSVNRWVLVYSIDNIIKQGEFNSGYRAPHLFNANEGEFGSIYYWNHANNLGWLYADDLEFEVTK